MGSLINNKTGEVIKYNKNPARSKPVVSQQAKKEAENRYQTYVEKSKPFWQTWFQDKSTNDTVVDSTTGTTIQVNKPTFLAGGVKSSAAGYVNSVGTLLDAVNQGLNTAENYSSDYASRQVQRMQESLQTGRTSDGRILTPTMRKTLESQISKYQRQATKDKPDGTFEERHPVLSSVQNTVEQTADDIAASAQRDTEAAKEGLGKFGQFMVDTGVAGTQLAGDVGLALLTGGSALVPMAVRSFGGAAQEARQSGASLGNQVAYGLGSAALSTATEKISNVAAPFRKVFGAGAADKLAGKLVKQFGESTAVKTMSKLAQTPAGKLAASALSEGSEEYVEDIFQPVLQRATYDPDASFDPSQALYDAAIGAALGGVGGAVDVAGSRESRVQSHSAPTEGASGAPVSVDTPATQTAIQSAAQPTVQPATDVMGQETKQMNGQIPQTVEDTAQTETLLDILLKGKRVDQTQANNQQFDALAERGGIGVDAGGKLYQMNPSEHIDQRNQETVRNRSVNAFQYDHPELQSYMKQAAESLIADADFSLQFPMTRSYERGMQGNKVNQSAQTSAFLREAMDETGLSRNQIIDAAQRIIHDQGQENVVAAKSVELILDRMLTDGYTTMYGETVSPNEAYISAKESIAGAAPEQTSEPLPIWDMPEAQTDGLGAADAGSVNTAYENLQAQSSRFYPEGANAARPVDVPMQDFSGRNISKSASTVMGAKAIPDDVVPMIEQLVAQGDLSYTVNTDQQAKIRAVSTIRKKGYDGAVEQFRNAVKKGTVSKDTVALGQALLNNAANAGDGNAVAELMTLYQDLSTNAGQALQAMSIFRKLSPESQLYGIQKIVDNLNESVNTKKKRSVTAADNVPVDQWMKKTGELLAKQLYKVAKPSPKKAQTVSQTILSDLRKFAKENLPDSKTATGNQRTEIDRIVDLFNNYENYQEAFESAKATIQKEYGKDAQVQSVLQDWIKSTLDYNAMFDSQIAKETGVQIQIDRDLITKFLQQQDQGGRDAVMEEIYDDIAGKVPSTWQDKWNAWRYLSMLANPRTHIRNSFGNLFFQPVRMMKNAVAAGIESGLEKAGVRIERTKSFGVSPSLYRAAWNDYSNVKDLLGGTKYDDAKSQINSRRKIFKNGVLETARTKNSAALEFEDAIFKRITYADSLTGYLRANGVTAEQLESGSVDAELLGRARDYAGKEALKATYQDRNAFSDRVVKISKDLGIVGEAILPFKRTPANILARAFDYSPAGVAKSIYDGLFKVKSGEKTAGEVIDEAASGLTGSALMALGAYMFASGMVTGAQGDDKDDKWAELLGHQGYAFEFKDGTSFTLDWLAPESLPFFMGVELMSSAGENGMDAESVWNAVKATANPMLDLSMLQSVNDLIDSVKYAEDAPLEAMIPSAIISYFSQAVPTLGGQIERSGESERMQTYTDKNSIIPTDVQYALGRASARIPLWDYQQIPYIDEWGRTESNGDPLLNAANNFLNPAYTSQVEVDAVEAELQKVRDATGDTAVFPAAAQRYVEVDGERKDLSAEEYEKYAKKLGSERYSLLQEAMQTDYYRSATSDQKAEYIADLYSYAGAVAKSSVSSYQLEDWQENASTAQQDIGVSPAEYIAMKQKYGTKYLSGDAYDKTKEAVNNGIPLETYLSYRGNTANITSDKDQNGNTIDGSKKSKVMAAINEMDLSTTEKDWLYYLSGYSESTISEAPWK